MIITKTPFRLSFFGGGTDYPAHYLEHGGAVLATSINKYCYISCRFLPPFFDHKYRIAYSRIENARSIDEIQHPAVKAVLNYLNISRGLEIHHDGDLPARSGLGSSSSFTTGLLNAIHALNGRMVSKYELAMQAIEVEQKVIGEKVGSQDQVLAAMGGFNLVNFNPDGNITVNPVIMSPKRKDDLNKHLLMFFSGVTRNSQTITPQKISDIKDKKNDLFEMRSMVDEGLKIISSAERDICDFGRLMHESWKLKRSISSHISTDLIDDIYTTAIDSGALGGKLLGAGGGGFLAFFAPPERHEKIKRSLSSYIHVPFSFENNGSTVCVYEPNGF
jgi:D-glycero-alpha-D-manno-heptose-7-phosphate kinase